MPRAMTSADAVGGGNEVNTVSVSCATQTRRCTAGALVIVGPGKFRKLVFVNQSSSLGRVNPRNGMMRRVRPGRTPTWSRHGGHGQRCSSKNSSQER